MKPINLSGKFWTLIGGWKGTSTDISNIFLGDFDGRLLDIQITPINALGTQNISEQWVVDGDIKEIQSFLWSDMEGIVPLVEKQVYKIVKE